MDVHVKRGLVIPASEIWYTTSRSGGPGGQHANKTSSRVTLHWYVEASDALGPRQKSRVAKKLEKLINDEGILKLSDDSQRSQYLNKKAARERLAALILDALKVQKVRKKTKPSRRAKQRRLDAKKQRSQKKTNRKNPKEWD